MMNVKKVIIATVIIIVFVTLYGCGGQTAEQQQAIDKVKNAKMITLSYDVTFKEKGELKTDGVSCSISKGNSYSTFRFIGSDKKTYKCEVSNEVFEEIKSQILVKEIKPYTIPSDSNGKLQYETVHTLIIVRDSGTDNNPLYLTEVPNINNIISKLQAIYDSIEK